MESESLEMIALETELRAETQRVLDREFIAPLRDVLEAELPSKTGETFRLGEVVDRNIEAIKGAESDEQRAERQKTLVSELVNTIKQLPSDSWSCSTRQLLENKAANCSNAASLLALILEQRQDDTGIKKFEYANPQGHSINIVSFDDGTMCYADPRNGVFEDVTKRMTVEDQPEMRLYVLKDPEPKMPHRFYPAVKKLHDIIVGVYAANMSEVPMFARGEFDENMKRTAPPEELAKMQAQAQVAQQREEINDKTAEKYKEMAARLKAPVRAFRNTDRFKMEAEMMKTGNDAEDALKRIGTRVRSQSELKQKLYNAKPSIRAFLLGESSETTVGDIEVEAALRLYRDAQQTADTLLHKSDEEKQHRVDRLLEKIQI